MRKRTNDPRKKLNTLIDDVANKTEALVKAKEKLEAEQSKIRLAAVDRIIELSMKIGGDIFDVERLLELFAENDILLEDMINKYDNEQLEFVSAEKKTETKAESPVGTQNDAVENNVVESAEETKKA